MTFELGTRSCGAGGRGCVGINGSMGGGCEIGYGGGTKSGKTVAMLMLGSCKVVFTLKSQVSKRDCVV